jgi:hypothetical protein
MFGDEGGEATEGDNSQLHPRVSFPIFPLPACALFRTQQPHVASTYRYIQFVHSLTVFFRRPFPSIKACIYLSSFIKLTALVQ